jgi:hypothetical protein
LRFPSVQRPLAPQRVMLSRRINAYYGLIRGSGSHPSAYALAAGPCEGQRFPAFIRMSFLPCRRPYPGGSTGRRCPKAGRVAFAVIGTSRHPRSRASWFVPGGVTRLHRSLYATAWKMACPSPTRAFTSELSSAESPRSDVGYNYAGQQRVPAAGLAPAGPAALRAAADEHR